MSAAGTGRVPAIGRVMLYARSAPRTPQAGFGQAVTIIRAEAAERLIEARSAQSF